MRLLQHCGMPAGDVDFIHGDGKTVGGILKEAPARSTLFTGSQAVAEHLVVDLRGKVTTKPPQQLQRQNTRTSSHGVVAARRPWAAGPR